MHTYQIHGQQLENVDKAKCLGVTIKERLILEHSYSQDILRLTALDSFYKEIW